jgi:hypothetical protein
MTVAKVTVSANPCQEREPPEILRSVTASRSERSERVSPRDVRIEGTLFSRNLDVANLPELSLS